MRSRHVLWHYLVIFLAALALRFVLLGQLPLSDPEAAWALQAHRLAAGERPLLGTQVAYVSLTASLFYVFESTNFLARFVPALAGSLLAWLPYAFRRRLKPIPGLLLSVFLAFDPGLVALSRQAGSPILGLTFALFMWACWDDNRTHLAGLFAGLALLSGPALWPGLLGLGLTWLLYRVFQPSPARRPVVETDAPPPAAPGLRAWKTVLAWAGGAILAFGSLFLLAPSGLTGWMGGISEYLRGWWQPSGVSAWRLLAALLVYEPLALVLALVGILRAWLQGYKRSRWLSLWLLNALLLALLYPARQVADLAWALIPLWGLAALELARHLRVPKEERLETLGVGVLTATVLGFAWLDLLSTARMAWPSPEATTRLVLFGGSFLLIIISLLLVGMGWSAATAKLGGLYGLLLVLGIYTLGAAWGTGGLRTPKGAELWDPAPRPIQAGLLVQTVDEISEWSTGADTAQPVTVVGVESPALEWLLRGRPLEVMTVLDPALTPPLVITRPTTSLAQPVVYRGQDFGWDQAVNWENMNAFTWLRWLALRDTPAEGSNLLLWARDDLFLDRSQ